MSESTYRTMTVEHLGPEATHADLERFKAVCETVHRRHPRWDDETVTDYVWNDGDIRWTGRPKRTTAP
jgi:hypothetical protein